MSGPFAFPLTSDEAIAAYLDGEMDAQTRVAFEARLETDADLLARLEGLDHALPDALPAFDVLLREAPHDRMASRLAAAISEPEAPPRAQPHRIGRRGLIAAGLALLASGAVLDRGVNRLRPAGGDAGWRAGVANYMSLYTTETIASLPDDDRLHEIQMAQVQRDLGLKISPLILSGTGVRFKRAQMLAFQGKPLAQLAYLDPESGPLAFCILAGSRGAGPLQSETREGLNLAFWSGPRHEFLLIGHLPQKRLMEMAQDIRKTMLA